jgi:hypothetical protein
MTGLPCPSCGCGYGDYQPNWCPVLGRIITDVNQIPHYFDRIPALGKNSDKCLGYTVKKA